MQIVIDIPEEDWEFIKESDGCRWSRAIIEGVINGTPQAEQKAVLDKIKAEIEQIEINGHIRDVECFRAGINTALNIIDKYEAESEGKE